MKVRFSVISFVPPGTSIAVVGSLPELGSWKVSECPSMSPSSPPKSMEPSFWSADIAVDDLSVPFEYKFVRKTNPSANWEWEGYGSHDNRKWDGKEMLSTPASEQDVKVFDGVFLLPPTHFMESQGMSEYSHTTRFYNSVKERNDMHYNRVSDNLWVGSCPRSRRHIEKLRDELKVTCLLNFQTHEDAKNNFPDPEHFPEWDKRTPQVIYDLFKEYSLAYVWIPTTDMSTQDRANMLPQAAFILGALIQNGHAVYVHCNAGVGRSVAAACGFLCYCLNHPVRLVHHMMCSSRPVAYFDEAALRAGRSDFQVKYGDVYRRLHEDGQKRNCFLSAGG